MVLGFSFWSCRLWVGTIHPKDIFVLPAGFIMVEKALNVKPLRCDALIVIMMRVSMLDIAKDENVWFRVPHMLLDASSAIGINALRSQVMEQEP